VALNTWTNYINEVGKTDIDFPVAQALPPNRVLLYACGGAWRAVAVTLKLIESPVMICPPLSASKLGRRPCGQG